MDFVHFVHCNLYIVIMPDRTSWLFCCRSTHTVHPSVMEYVYFTAAKI
jgi:hypothetical protein